MPSELLKMADGLERSGLKVCANKIREMVEIKDGLAEANALLLTELAEAQKSKKYYEADSAAAWDKCEERRKENEALKAELATIKRNTDQVVRALHREATEFKGELAALKAQSEPVAYKSESVKTPVQVTRKFFALPTGAPLYASALVRTGQKL